MEGARVETPVKYKEDPLKPNLPLLCKLGSIVVHAEKLMSPGGHRVDVAALQTLFNDPDVKAWIKGMPVKR